MPYSDPEKKRAYDKVWREANREVVRTHHVRTRFGLTLEEYDKLMAEPCAICGEPSAHLDHCHDTGKIRLALCAKCNRGLGSFNDDPKLLATAAAYLLHFKEDL